MDNESHYGIMKMVAITQFLYYIVGFTNMCEVQAEKPTVCLSTGSMKLVCKEFILLCFSRALSGKEREFFF